MACVLIEVNDQGQVSVGSYPSEQIPQEIKASLQPAESMDAALEQARQLLQEGQPTEDQSFEKGYSHGRGTPMFEGV